MWSSGDTVLSAGPRPLSPLGRHLLRPLLSCLMLGSPILLSRAEVSRTVEVLGAQGCQPHSSPSQCKREGSLCLRGWLVLKIGPWPQLNTGF